ncbi:LOW QUALITY PROTEIN: hypothetical protein U0070_019242, partial [Myodes glareolus]
RARARGRRPRDPWRSERSSCGGENGERGMARAPDQLRHGRGARAKRGPRTRRQLGKGVPRPREGRGRDGVGRGRAAAHKCPGPLSQFSQSSRSEVRCGEAAPAHRGPARAPAAAPNPPRSVPPSPPYRAGRGQALRGLGPPGTSTSGAVTQHVDVSDAEARAAPPSLSECRPGRGGGEWREGAGGRGDPGVVVGRGPDRGWAYGSPGRAEVLAGRWEVAVAVRCPPWPDLALPGARSLRHRAHPAPARNTPTAMEAEETMECLQEFPEHHKMILDRLNEQREQDRFTDITLIVDGHHFKAHKAVLAACSKFFYKFFQEFTQEPLVEIEGKWHFPHSA